MTRIIRPVKEDSKNQLCRNSDKPTIKMTLAQLEYNGSIPAETFQITVTTILALRITE